MNTRYSSAIGVSVSKSTQIVRTPASGISLVYAPVAMIGAFGKCCLLYEVLCEI